MATSLRAVCFITCGREFTGETASNSYEFSQLAQGWTVVVGRGSGEWHFGCVHDSVSVCGGKVGWRMCV